MAAPFSLKELEDDPRLFLYTSLTAGSSHIITATSRMETILKANRIPFQAIDTATDEKARRLWQRRAGQRKLPGLVKEGFVIGDLNEVEEWNEFGELKENIGPVPANNAAPPGGQVGVNIAPPSLPINPTATQGTTFLKQPPVNKAPQPGFDKSKAIKLPGAEEIAARNNKEKTATTATISSPPSNLEAINLETLTSSPEDKKQSIEKAKEAAAAKETETDTTAAPVSETESFVAKEQTEPVKQAEKEVQEVESAAKSTPAVHFAEEPKKETTTPAEKQPEVQSEKAEPSKDEAQKPKEEDKETEAETEAVTKSVADLKVDKTEAEEERTQEQNPKEAENAAKSVED